MYLITILLSVILLCGNNVELTLFKNSFQFYVENVASTYHSNWRENFIYPMILTVGLCLVHRNLKVARARYNSSLIYVDILNMEYNELPSDWAHENRATAQVACKYVLQGLRRKRLFKQSLIEEISDIVHIQWMKRNAEYAPKELMVPYVNLTEIEKDKDRKAVFLACRLFNELYLYHRFNTTPILFVGYIIQ
jgi:hypothetical protein